MSTESWKAVNLGKITRENTKHKSMAYFYCACSGVDSTFSSFMTEVPII